MKVFADNSQAQGIPGFYFIAAGQADAAPTVIDGFAAIIAVRICQLMGKHQIFGQGKSVIFSFVFHGLNFSRQEHPS